MASVESQWHSSGIAVAYPWHSSGISVASGPILYHDHLVQWLVVSGVCRKGGAFWVQTLQRVSVVCVKSTLAQFGEQIVEI